MPEVVRVLSSSIPSNAKVVRTSLRLQQSTHRGLKMLALELGVTMEQIVDTLATSLLNLKVPIGGVEGTYKISPTGVITPVRPKKQ